MDLVTQYMDCKTTGVTRPIGEDPVVNTPFRPGYALVSKQWDKQRVALRLKDFQTTGKDHLFPDYNDEWGMRSRRPTYSDLWITSA